MKKIIFIICMLAVNLSFSQEGNYINSALLEASVKENYIIEYKVSNEIKKMISEISLIDLKKFEKNSEGKFSVKIDNDLFFFDLEKINKVDQKSILVTKFVKSEKVNKKRNLATDIKSEFIEKTILKKVQEDIKSHIKLYESLSFGDQQVKRLRNYDFLLNKLMVDYEISKNTQIQIGNSLYPYLNKILKTEIDKTVNSSLNLIAINF